MNSETSKTSDPHRLLLDLSDKINLKKSDKYKIKHKTVTDNPSIMKYVNETEKNNYV